MVQIAANSAVICTQSLVDIITQSQDAHNLIRNYVINHLLDTTQSEDIEHNMGRHSV